MKRTIIASVLILFASALFAQNTVVLSAYNYLKNGQLEKAKQYIDQALQNEQSKTQAKTWFYAGNIYLSISITTNEKYKALCENPLQVAYDSYLKALEIEPEISNEMINPSSPKIGLMIVGQEYYKKGAAKYTEKKYEDALPMFEMAKKINNSLGIKDSNSAYIASSCAITIKDDKKAKSLLSDLEKMNYKEPLVYYNLANLIRKDGDTTKATNVLKKGLSIMPKNPKMLYVAGIYYDESNKFDESEKAYKDALAMNSEFFDAQYNLGALYVNTASKVMEEANKLPINETAKYNELKAKAEGLMDKALPCLEKAESLSPKDELTLLTLKQIYARKGNTDKIKEIEAKIAALKQ